MARADESSGDAAAIPVYEPVADLTKREEQTEARAKERIAAKTLSVAPISTPQRPQEASTSQAAPRAAAAASPATPSVQGAAAPAVESLEPKAWLERIVELRRQGKLEGSRQELEGIPRTLSHVPAPSGAEKLALSRRLGASLCGSPSGAAKPKVWLCRTVMVPGSPGRYQPVACPLLSPSRQCC